MGFRGSRLPRATYRDNLAVIKLARPNVALALDDPCALVGEELSRRISVDYQSLGPELWEAKGRHQGRARITQWSDAFARFRTGIDGDPD